MRLYYYSPVTGGFYLPEIHTALFDVEGDVITPIGLIAGARPVTEAQHAALIAGQDTGKVIVAGQNGDPELADPPPPTTAELMANITARLQEHLEQTAQAYGYDSISSAISYADEPAVPKFQREGQAIRAWRSMFWDAANAIFADVKAGTRPVPTAAELIAELPELTLPADS